MTGSDSNHISGNSYSWIQGPDNVEIATAPEWLLSLIKESQKKSWKTSLIEARFDGTFQEILDGTRNNR